jgi:hypothetical protein
MPMKTSNSAIVVEGEEKLSSVEPSGILYPKFMTHEIRKSSPSRRVTTRSVERVPVGIVISILVMAAKAPRDLWS